jgi:TPR repeat protein
MSTENQVTDESMSLSSGISAFESKHFAMASRLLSPIAEEGNADAQFRMAIMCQNGLGMVRNDEKALEFMRSAAEQGHALAQHGLGFMYHEGECVEKDEKEAAKWFHLAADQGMAGSMTTLAMMYQEGRGVEQNEEEARRLYKEAGFNPDEM